ncbi:MAG: nucleotide exchange factor GrpE [Gemmatimonadota bacterium]
MRNRYRDIKSKLSSDQPVEGEATGSEEASDASGPEGNPVGAAGGPGDPGDPGGSGGPGEPATPSDPATLAAELAELKDRHLRLAAEFENFRKRTRKEAMDGRTMAQADLVQQLLPTLDDLARVADTPHESTTVEALDKGIELILLNLRKHLEAAGMERVEALDQKFDPQRHQAVVTTPVDDPALDDTVSRVFVQGYEFLGRLVRPAQVEVRRYEPGGDADSEADGEAAN